MMRVAVDIPGVEARYDLRSNSWKIQFRDETLVLRDWNWGERYGLVYRSTADGRFDRRTFVDFVFSELLDHAPEKYRIILADTVLELLGVPRRQPGFSLAHGEFLLARAFGWRPSQLSEEPVASLDNMIKTLVQEEQQRNAASKRYEDEGWTSIVFQAPPPDPSSENANRPNPEDMEQELLSRLRLQEKLDAVAIWAGETIDWTEQDDGRSFGGDIVSGAMPGPTETTGQSAVNSKPEISNNRGEPFPASSVFKKEQTERAEKTSTFYKGIARLKTDARRSGRKTEESGDTEHLPSHARVRLSRLQPPKLHSEPDGEASAIREMASSNMPPPSGSSREPAFRASQDKAGTSGPNASRFQSSGAAKQTSVNMSAGPPAKNGNLAKVTTARLARPRQAKADTGKATSPASGIVRVPSANARSERSQEASRRLPETRGERHPLFSVAQNAPAKKKNGLASFSAKSTGNRGRGLPEHDFLSETARHPKSNSAETVFGAGTPWRAANMDSLSKQMEISRQADAIEPSTADNPFEYAASRPEIEPSHPFALSELEERMADVLERAAREAGVDLP